MNDQKRFSDLFLCVFVGGVPFVAPSFGKFFVFTLLAKGEREKTNYPHDRLALIVSSVVADV